MRYTVLVAALLLGSCASVPGNDTAMYNGVYAPRITEIAKDARFTARSSVWRHIDRAIADAAARHQLRIEAEKAGYSHVEIGAVNWSSLFGQQVLIVGRLFRKHNAPQDAVPVAFIETLGRLPGFGIAKPRKSPKAKRAGSKPKRVASLNKPKPKAEVAPAKAVRPAGPVVIKAPEFIDEVPAKVQ